MSESHAIIQQALALYCERARACGDEAAHNGARHDGGMREMLALAEAYEAGLTGATPAFLSREVAEVKRRAADPEFAEYQRLKQKYGG